MTLEEVYKGLSLRMDVMTEELVRIGTVVDKLETLDKVTVKNGDDKEYTQPRQQFVQWAYDNGKPGGLIDQKIETAKVLIDQKIETAKSLIEDKISKLDPVKQEDEKDRMWDRRFKIAGRVVLMVLGLVFLVKFVDWNTVFDLMR